MASVHGTSGAWKEISAHLASVRLTAGQPAEIASLLESCSEEYERQLAEARHTLEDEIALLEQEISQEKEKVATALAEYREKYALDIEQAEAHIDFYQHDRRISNFIRSFFRIRRESGKLERLHQTVDEYRFEIEGPLREKESLREKKVTGKEAQAEALCQEARAKVEVLKNITGSATLASAAAELEMIACLARLPENVQVLNDLYLRTDRGLRFENEWLIEAEIHHLVITPAGLFAIEVHHSGKPAAEKAPAIDPQQQIRRAAHLLHSFLKPKFPGLTVRSILTYRGHLPESQKTGIVKTLPIPDVPGYIDWFKDHSLDEAQIQRLVEYVQEIAG
jgi:hypothetical protein